MGMQQGMGLFAERFPEIFLVHLDDARVLVALADWHIPVFFVNSLLTGFDYLKVTVANKLPIIMHFSLPLGRR